MRKPARYSLQFQKGFLCLALLLAFSDLKLSSYSFGSAFEGSHIDDAGFTKSGALMINELHPDLPLKYFAAGKLGVISPSWAKSYLIVCYRYLNRVPLDKREQDSILALWHQRIAEMNRLSIVINAANDYRDDPAVVYFDLRNQVLGKKGNRSDWRYDFDYDSAVLDDAFCLAKKNLELMIKKFGCKSKQVMDWLSAQDQVFGCNDSHKSKIPPAAPASADPLSKSQRDYQLAAASFYALDFNQAKQRFQTIASKNDPYWQELAEYMVSRCAVNAALLAKNESGRKQAWSRVAETLKSNPKSKYADDLVNLQTLLTYAHETPAESLKQLCKAVMRAHSERFGNNAGDITSLMDDSFEPYEASSKSELNGQMNPTGLSLEKNELTDWLNTIKGPEEEVFPYIEDQAKKEIAERRKTCAAHALKRWRQTHSMPWLVAALSSNSLLLASNHDLANAANQMTPDSVTFLTARFYLIDLMIKSGRKEEARNSLLKLLQRKDLAPSDKNIFQSQLQMVSRTPQEFFHSMIQCPTSYSYSSIHSGDDTPFPSNWRRVENEKSYYRCTPTICDLHCDDLNENLPFSYWVSLARDKTIPAKLHAEVIRCAWLRSVILGRESGLEDALGQAYPSLRKLVQNYKNAPAGPEKRFSLACVILLNRGMDLDLEPVNHHGGIDEHDYFNHNYWETEAQKSAEREPAGQIQEGDSVDTIFSSYEKPVLKSLLTRIEQKRLEAEQKVIAANDPPHLLCETVVGWARSHPNDPRVPEMLYRIVKLPFWSKHTQYGSRYSHAAYTLLHKQYHTSSWAKSLSWWY